MRASQHNRQFARFDVDIEVQLAICDSCAEQVAPINGNGTVGTWTATTAFPIARFGHTSVAYNGYLYVIGGNDGALSDVKVAPINGDGTVGNWVTTTALATPRAYHTSVADNGYLYVIGGYDGAGNLDDVQVARFE